MVMVPGRGSWEFSMLMCVEEELTEDFYRGVGMVYIVNIDCKHSLYRGVT